MKPRLPFLRYGLPLTAAGLLAFALYTSTAHPQRPVGEPPITPARSPFPEAVAGLGVVEPNSELIAIGTHLPGVVSRVHVAVGQKVARGDPLFTVDDRDARARIGAERARLESARVAVADTAQQYALYHQVSDRRAVSQDELDRRRFAAESAEAQLREAEARIRVLETELERLTVRAPIPGTVLRVNARAGEYAAVGPQREPLMTLGNIEPLHVRVELDETDAARFEQGAPAVARLRGDGATEAALEFVRAEPLLRPKRTLTGDGNERVDTRVLEVVFALPAAAAQARVGQQVDVFIRAGGTGRGRAS
ncbi:MAG TPA: efflux RND transporter periplasmic adaptor subunit [Burkholderiales bacterium]|nr:efflux RND transporter periplasmic adaptor subunit [Burkholderiales bacterium]